MEPMMLCCNEQFIFWSPWSFVYSSLNLSCCFSKHIELTCSDLLIFVYCFQTAIGWLWYSSESLICSLCTFILMILYCTLHFKACLLTRETAYGIYSYWLLHPLQLLQISSKIYVCRSELACCFYSLASAIHLDLHGGCTSCHTKSAGQMYCYQKLVM